MNGYPGAGRLIFAILLAAVLCRGLQACSGSQGAAVQEQTIAGRIYAIGNEPFVRVGLDVGGEMIELKCGKELEQLLLSNQLKRVRVHVRSVQSLASGKAAEVLSVEFMNE